MISVVMGVYNGEKTVERAIFSILQGSYKDLEFIVVDDGSTDGTYEIIQSIATTDNRLKVVQSDKNYGLANALNRAISLSSGEFLARMDADDYAYPSRLERQMEYLKNNSNIAFVGTGAKLVDGNTVWGERKYPKIVTDKLLIKYNPFVHPTLLIRKVAIDKVGGYCEESYCNRCEDYDLYFRLYKEGFVGGNIEEVLLDYQEKHFSADRHSKSTRKNEYAVRKKGTKLLKGNLFDYFYCIKPLFLMHLSDKTYNFMHNNKWNKNI